MLHFCATLGLRIFYTDVCLEFYCNDNRQITFSHRVAHAVAAVVVHTVVDLFTELAEVRIRA